MTSKQKIIQISLKTIVRADTFGRAVNELYVLSEEEVMTSQKKIIQFSNQDTKQNMEGKTHEFIK